MSRKLQQVGNARDIYEEPDNKFVANFIGETNLIDVTVSGIEKGQAALTLPGGAAFSCPAADGAHQGAGHLSVRPERVTLTGDGSGLLAGSTTRLIYLGTDMHVEVTLDDGELVTARVQNSQTASIPNTGDRVGLDFDSFAARLLVD